MVTMSETLRLEYAPFGVRVISVITGAVSSNIMSHGDSFDLPDGSSYRPVIKNIADVSNGDSLKSWMKTETYAERVVGDVVDATTTGKIWRGSMASTVHFVLTKLPTFLVVRHLSSILY